MFAASTLTQRGFPMLKVFSHKRILWSLTLFIGLAACGRLTPQASLMEEASAFDRMPDASLPKAAPTDVIVQLFNWPFKKIADEMPQLAGAGYAQIHVSPPNLTIASDQWWGRYQPVDYRMISGPLGTQEEFTDMIQVAHKHGLKIIVDIVFNHTANESSPLPPEAFELSEKLGPLFTSQDYNPAFCINDYNDVGQVRNGRLCAGQGDRGLPDLKQTSSRVLAVQQDYLKLLSSLGVDGYRMDAVKHMEPSYFKKLFTEELQANKFIFGEIIADASNYQRDLAPYLSETTMAFYDFPLRDTLQKAMSPGGRLASIVDFNGPGEYRKLPWNRSVAFIMNHDIPNNDGFRSMILDPKDEALAYAYLLGRSEGVPYVYSDLGIKGGGGLRDDRWAYAHRSPLLKSMIYFHNAVHGSNMQILLADDCHLVFSRGDRGLVGINKCGNSFSAFVNTPFSVGQSYYDVLQGQEFTIQGSYVEMRLPPRSAVMFVKKNFAGPLE